MTKVLLAVILVISLQACTNQVHTDSVQPEKAIQKVAKTTIATACNIIHYYHLISVLNDNQERQAAETLLSNASGSGKLSDCNQIKLAILLSAPGSSMQDDKTSLELLSGFINTAKSITQADLTFATLLKEFVEERSMIRYQRTKTRDLLLLEQQETEVLKGNLTKTRQQLQQLKSLESELNHQEKRIAEDSAS